MYPVCIVIISMDIWITPYWSRYKSEAFALLYIILDLFLKLQPWHSKYHYTLNIYINMRLVINIYITYNIKYPQYIYTVSKKLILAFKQSFYIFFLHKHKHQNEIHIKYS